MKFQTYHPESNADLVSRAELGPIVFLHGFPGARSEQNRELAQRVANLTGRDAIVLLYAGVDDKSRVFTFEKGVEEAHAYFADLFARETREISLVGHSWGGYMTLTLIQKFAEKMNRVVFLSPLLEFAELDIVVQAFTTMYELNPQIRIESVQALSEEFAGLETKKPASPMIREIPENLEILFLQSRNDDVTPTATAQSKLKEFTRAPDFELVDTEHNFLSNREWVSHRIANFLKA